jgi:hypothetical protein
MQNVGFGQLVGAQQYAAVATPSETEISSQIRLLSEAVACMGDVVKKTCDRLQPVQRIEPGRETASSTAPRPVLCSLAEQIRNLRESVECATATLEDNCKRLEI